MNNEKDFIKQKLDDEVKAKIIAFLLFVSITALLLIYTIIVNNPEKKTYKIAFIPKTIESGNDFWTSLTDGAKLAAKESEIDLYISGANSEQDVEGQIENIEKVLEMKPDALVLSPCSYSGMTYILEEVVQRDIKLILIDSVIDKDLALSVVATDNFLAGKQLGQYAGENISDEDKIGIIAHVEGSSTAMEREAGIKSGLGKRKANVVKTAYCGSSYDKAYSLTKELIANNPDVNVIFGTNEYASVGAARAVRESERDNIKVYGFDNSLEEIKLLEQGVFDAIVIQKPFNMGYLGVMQALDVLENEKVEKNIDSGCKLIDKDNMYEDENQRLLYPFSGQK